mmetsp:Transcript_6789/g.18142  ORF Transcript_6789/g.18142 Transcript_6789/m.18142 type:complete len:85 (-) Transcript_6789:62-316(-)
MGARKATLMMVMMMIIIITIIRVAFLAPISVETEAHCPSESRPVQQKGITLDHPLCFTPLRPPDLHSVSAMPLASDMVPRTITR